MIAARSKAIVRVTGDACFVRECIVDSNGEDGIVIRNGCYVFENLCRSNGATSMDGAGIAVEGTAGDQGGSRIEGNSVASNDCGIRTLGISDGHIMIKNTARCNGTNYSITGSQVEGPIVTGQVLATATNGDHPWANLSLGSQCP